MFKTLVLALLVSFSLSSLASDKLVLLTSLDPVKNRPALRSKAWDINKKLEKIFYSRLTPYYTTRDKLKIIHFATIEDLTRELGDPENRAVFWVSHSNGSGLDNGFDRNIVVDYQGKDLSEGFQNPSSELTYLAFVGCHAKYLVENFLEKGFMSNNENLKTYSSVKRVDARKALKRAIGHYIYHSYRDNLSSSDQMCQPVERIELTVSRELPKVAPEGHEITAIKVMQRDRLLGVFPKGLPGERQELTIHLAPGERKKDLKLVFDSGIASEQVVMGEFNIREADYRVFATRDGRILGKGRYVFNLKGSVEDLPQAQLVNKINCFNN